MFNQNLTGSGKSTLIENIQSHIKTDINVGFLFEPVIEFLEWKNYKPLALFEMNPKKYGVASQLHIIRTLSKYYRERLVQFSNYDLVICDRYITSAFPFINTLHECDFITDFDKDVLKETLWDYMSSLSQVDKTFYLKRDTKWCLDHIKLRNRDGELAICNDQYISELIKQYDIYIKNVHHNYIIETTDLNVMTDIICDEIISKIL